MQGVRYVIINDLPSQVTQDPDFLQVNPGEVKVKVLRRGDQVLVVAYGDDARLSEALLRSLGAQEIGVDLCG